MRWKPMLFDRWVMPAIAPVSISIEEQGFALHDILTKLLIRLAFIHMLGALTRKMEGDGTLRRMIKGRARG